MGGKSSKSKMDVTIYYMGIHMGIAHTIDSLVELEVGGKSLWKGSMTENGALQFDQRWLFGGDTKEGGIWGWGNLLMGRKNQQVHQGLADMLGGAVPAFRGIASFFYNGEICANSPYAKAWKMRVQRTESERGWGNDNVWYKDKVTIWQASGQIKSMNPAHIMYLLWTGSSFRNLDKARLDDAAWRKFADVLYNESFGLCFKWSSQNSLADFMQQVIDHVGAAQYVDRHTGLIVPVAVRGGYDVDALPLFTPDTGLLGIDEYTTDALQTGINEVIVNYKDPLDQGNKRQVREKNLGAIHAQNGTVNSTTIDYIGIPTSTLARRVARRDLNALAGFIRRFKVRLDRRAAGAAVPAGLIRISDPARGIQSMVLRIAKPSYGTYKSGVVVVEASTDVFGLPDTVYNTDEPSGHIPPDPTPKPIVTRALIEVPYRDLVYNLTTPNLEALQTDSSFVAAVAMRPTALSRKYYLHDRINGSGAEFVNKGGDMFCGSGLLAADVGYLDIQIVLNSVKDLVEVQLGGPALLGDEIVRIDAYDELTNMVTIGRGCADTVPVKHDAAERMWFYQDATVNDITEYSTGVKLDVKLQPETNAGVLNLVSADVDQITFKGRAALPYPPGKLQINALAYPIEVGGEMAITWAHRNRLSQAEQMIDTLQASITPEDTTTYTLRLIRADTQQVLFEQTNIPGTTAAVKLSYEGNVVLELWAVRSGSISWQAHKHLFNYTGAGEQQLTLDSAKFKLDSTQIRLDQTIY